MHEAGQGKANEFKIPTASQLPPNTHTDIQQYCLSELRAPADPSPVYYAIQKKPPLEHYGTVSSQYIYEETPYTASHSSQGYQQPSTEYSLIDSHHPQLLSHTAPYASHLMAHETVLPPEIVERSPLESVLDRYFAITVGGMSVVQLAVLAEGRKAPKSLRDFSFVPITPKTRADGSLTAAKHKVTLPPDIRATYNYGQGDERPPYLDSQFAIGLAKNGWLVAIASGGLDEQDRIKIVQIQDVSCVNSKYGATAKDRFKTGLHDGMDWRATLVEAWTAFALQNGIGDEIVVQSGQNNRWCTIYATPHHPGYDGVAERLGFVQTTNGDWTRPLATIRGGVEQSANLEAI